MLALRRAKLGEDHPHTLVSLFNLALSYEQAGRLDDAVSSCRLAADGMLATLGSDHSQTLQVASELVRLSQLQEQTMDRYGYDDASCTLSWDPRMGSTTAELLRLLRELTGTLRHLHVA